MLQAMAAAECGDDVFGEDPSVNQLEAYAANLFGRETALFCPSGTMANQIAIKVHTRPGDEVICDENSHVFFYEGGGIAFNAGAQVRTVHGNRGRITAAQVEPLINPDDVHRARTRLVCVENTANRGGGSCYEPDVLPELRDLCRKHGLAFHLDGARLWNALIAKGETAAEYGALFDSISVCLSKGLGAPVGSLLIGDAAFIREARRVRKVLGGGMRQAGVLAAAGLYAMQHQFDRLADDHQNALQLAEALRRNAHVSEVMPVETNIVIAVVKLPYDAAFFAATLREKGIRVLAMAADRVRFVTHLDITPEMMAYTLEQVRSMV